ncbi:related to transcription initiation factor TFIIIC [Rhynchosporium secalis]|uniref:Related to transcription initiation factor TFIIIC n=1 Tax=Rhynchosporium secalis TaxID=38038 RepID=A0A1E1MN62_RHYSE|nr:related to transcription initiation factor TFIIIC [Rhynchosporium secalis]
MSHQKTTDQGWQPEYFASPNPWWNNLAPTSNAYIQYQPFYQTPYASHPTVRETAQERADREEAENGPVVPEEPEDTIFRDESGDVRSDDEDQNVERPDIIVRPTALMNFERNILQIKKPTKSKKPARQLPSTSNGIILGMGDVDETDGDDDGEDEEDGDNDEDSEQPARKKRRYFGPTGPGTGTKRGPRKAAPMAPDVARRMGEANSAWLAKEPERAVELALEVVRLNAETYQAWVLLATVWNDLGEKSKAANALFYAAHLRPKHLEAWMTAADYCLNQTGSARESFYPTAHECYSFALRQIPHSYEPRIEKARLNVIRGCTNVAVADFDKALNLRPHDRGVLEELASASLDIGMANVAIAQYQKTITHLRTAPDDTGAKFSWDDTGTYVSLLEYDDQWEVAIKETKSIVRWLLGREDEAFWDDVTHNDCEYDLDNSRRRAVPKFVPGKYPSYTYGDGLVLELRVRLGINRLNLGDFEEALMHFYYLDPLNDDDQDNVLEYPQLFREVSDALFEATYYQEALNFYEPLRQVPEIVDTKMLINMGKCAQELGDQSEAEEYYLAAALDENDVESRTALAHIYEAQGDKESALSIINEIVLLQKEDRPQKRKYQRRKEPAMLTSENIRTIEEEGAESFLQPEVVRKNKKGKDPLESKRKLRDKWGYGRKIEAAQRLQKEFIVIERTRDRMRAGDIDATEEWIHAAEELTDDFRSFKAFYPWEKFVKFEGYNQATLVEGYASLTEDLSAMAERLSRDKDVIASLEQGNNNTSFVVPEKYRGLAFAAWLDIFMEYAICLAGQLQLEKAYAICQAALDSTVWCHSLEDTFVIQLCMCLCSVLASDDQTALVSSKYFTKKFQFTTDSYRLTSALARVIHSPVSWYCSGPMQKFILRQIKTMDFSLVDEQGRKKIMEKGSYSAVDENGNTLINTDMDINLLMMYGYILYSSNSYSLALNYFFRCYALDPQNPVINLVIGLSYISDCLKRQTENRQYAILQGKTFMMAYYEARKNSEFLEERQEAHYNMARAYHMLGLPHLALPFYQRVLNEVSHAPRSMREDLVVDTAYNLQQMYTTVGNMELAKQITKRWLVI